MNVFKILGCFCLVFASVFLIYGVYIGWATGESYLKLVAMEGGVVEPAHYWDNFRHPFTPFALQAAAFYAIGGIGIFFGRHKQKTSKKQQALGQHDVSSKPESPNSVSFTYCPFCGKEMPQGNYPLCPFCGKSFGVFHK